MKTKKLALALQGGGSHGAITWGVLDRLLEEKGLELEAWSGTSAGAMNAAVLAYGLKTGGPVQAQKLLGQFWRAVSDTAQLSLLQPSFYDVLFGEGNMDHSPAYWWTETLSSIWSPYQLNPSNVNPLQNILKEVVTDFSILQDDSCKLFVCATNVRSGNAKIFAGKQLSAKAVLASACLPNAYQAVTIDGESYWDGGFMGNPPLYPLIRAGCKDILLVQITPVNIKEVPDTANEIKDRLTEISFNSSLLHELRGISFVNRLLKEGVKLDPRYKNLHLHSINPEDEITHLHKSSMLNARWNFLCELRDLGRKQADEWLQNHYKHIGAKSTFELPVMYE